MPSAAPRCWPACRRTSWSPGCDFFARAPSPRRSWARSRRATRPSRSSSSPNTSPRRSAERGAAMDNIRRQILRAAGAGVALGTLGACAAPGRMGAPASAQVVVIGGGYGGATAAKYIRMWSDNKISVVLVEPNAEFVSCPISNLVLGGFRQMADITVPYDGLEKNHGVRRVRDTVTKIDTAARKVTLAGGATIGYDKLVVSPG